MARVHPERVMSRSCIFRTDITVCSALRSRDFDATYVVKCWRAHLRRHSADVSTDRQGFKMEFV